MRVLWLLAVAAGVGAVAVEVLAVRAGEQAGSAVLDFVAGCSLVGAGVVGRSFSMGCRVMAGLAGVLWFVGTLQVLGGSVGRAGELWGSLYAAPLAAALLSAPAAWPVRRSEQGLVICLWLRGLIPVLAAWNVATLAASSALGAAGLRRPPLEGSAVIARRAAAALGGILAVAAGVRLTGTSSGWLEPVLVVVVSGCGGVLMLVGRRPPTATVVTSLVLDVGRRQDAGTLERRLAEALGDPGLRLRYRLRSGGDWLDASGRVVSAPVAVGDQVVTLVEVPGGTSAALVHDAAALEDRELREAVASVVRLAVERLRLSSDAAAQVDELVASQRRLVQAGQEQRAAFAVEIREGPQAELGRAADLLAVAVDSAPRELAELLSAAVNDLAETRADLAAAVPAGAGGLEEALAHVAHSAGLRADIRLAGAPLPAAVAEAGWYCASEAIANALKHAGGARVSLSAYCGDGALVIEVGDDGPGGADPAGSGLSGLRARAEARHGELRLDSPPGGGTRVVVRLPLPQG